MQGIDEMGTGNTNQMGVAHPDNRNIYIFTSNGPDRIDDSQPIMPFPMANPICFLAYEVTDRLISIVDICRFDGTPILAVFRI